MVGSGMNELELQDYIVVHGGGEATEYGVRLAQEMWDDGEDDYAIIAAEVVYRGLTTEDFEADYEEEDDHERT